MSPLAERVTSAAFRAGWSAVRLLPAGAAYRTFDLAALAAHRRDGTTVRRLRDNYRRVRPELDEAALDALTREGVRSYLRYWCEAFRLPDATPGELADVVRAVGDEAPRRTLAGGRGVVLFLGHLGNWDTCGAWATHHFAPVTTVAERLRPEDLFERFLAYRQRLGMRILPLTGGDAVFRQLVRTVRDGGCVPLLADRDLTAGGVKVGFCGHRARMAAGPAALALATGAPLHPVSVHYEPHPGRRRGPAGHRLVVTFGPELHTAATGRAEQVQDLTQQCADHLAAAVRAHTQDWHMAQQVFVDAGRRQVVR